MFWFFFFLTEFVVVKNTVTTSLAGRGLDGYKYICGWSPEPLRCSPETTTTLLISYTQHKIKNWKKKKKPHMEKEMATHSSILAWKSPWTEEPGGLQSMGLHDWACVHEGGGR